MPDLNSTSADPGWPSQWAQALLDPSASRPAHLHGPGSVRGQTGLSVHRNNVLSGLIDVLADSFDVVQQLVGVEFFRAMAAQFVRLHPPQSPILLHYGAAMPAFIRQFEPAAVLPYLADVAQLEWCRQVALHAADAPAAAQRARLRDPLDLARLDPGLQHTAALLHPSVACLAADHAAVSVWRAHQTETPALALANLDWQRPEQACIWRLDDQVLVQALVPAELTFLQALQAGHSLARAEHLAAASSTHVDAVGLLSWMQRQGLLIGLMNHMEETS